MDQRITGPRAFTHRLTHRLVLQNRNTTLYDKHDPATGSEATIGTPGSLPRSVNFHKHDPVIHTIMIHPLWASSHFQLYMLTSQLFKPRFPGPCRFLKLSPSITTWCALCAKRSRAL